MTKICWLSWLSNRKSALRRIGPVAGGIGVAILLATGIAVAQTAAPEAQPVTAPKGYTVHQTIDLGGRMANVNGSGAMYDTLVNEQSGPRILNETFELRALPDTKNPLFDVLTARGSGFGGDPYSFAKMDFYKGKAYEFSGMFRRDRQYFDYDLLGNPNIPSGQTIPIGPTAAPTGSLPYAQVNDSPFLANTVRRMTDVGLTIFPLDKVSYRVAYSHNTFEGPSLTPGGYEVAGSYDLLMSEYLRNSTDSLIVGADVKPVRDTRLTFEEQLEHIKLDSFFTPDQAYFNVQEPDGTKVALLYNYDSLSPYNPAATGAGAACNANSIGTTPGLSAPVTQNGLPVVNPACNVMLSYTRTQPTRFFYPTEIFRFQSSSIRNISMNGDVRYTYARMNLPGYYENWQGLAKTTRAITVNANSSAKREVMAAEYGIVWQATPLFRISDEVTYSSAQQPGTSTTTSVVTLSTPTTAGNETINAGGLITTSAAQGASTGIGHSSLVNVPLPDFYGQRFITNDLTATWDGFSRATLSLTYRHRNHLIGEGIPHNAPLAPAADNGTVTINEDGGIFNAVLRPTSRWDINGSAELLFDDNAFTPVGPRRLEHFRVHTLYRAKSWATLSGAYNDLERNNNTNNIGPSADGPLNHVDHSRIASIGAQLTPNAHYGLDLNYSFSDVYASTNICYNAAPSAAYPGAATASGTACPGATVRGAPYLEYGPTKDFIDAPTNYGSAAVRLSTNDSLQWDLGYRITAVDGSRFYNDARDVAGSLSSKYQSPFAKIAWTVHPGWIWRAEYSYYGYGEGGPSGAPYCSANGPTATAPATVVPCTSTGAQVGLTLPSSGETSPRTFRANNILLGFHYEF